MAWIWVGLSVFVAFGIEAMTGFGSIVLALSLSALVFDVTQLVPIMVPLNIMMTGPLVYRHRRHVDLEALLRGILPWMALGTALGLALAPRLGSSLAELAFAVLIIWVAWRALWVATTPALSRSAQRGIVTGAGVTHGLFASGGPLLVYALARTGMDKARFRATLLCVWFSLNAAMTVWFLVNGALQPHATTLAALAPCVLLGAWLGNRLHTRIEERCFKPVVYGVLLVVGVVLAATALWTLIRP